MGTKYFLFSPIYVVYISNKFCRIIILYHIAFNICRNHCFSNTYGVTFIFSFKYENNFKDAVLSKVKDTTRALQYHPEHGPCFGNDLLIFTSENSADIDFDTAYCGVEYYEKSIRKEGEFSIDDYEVFQIIT